jgi:rhamnosyltransferase
MPETISLVIRSFNEEAHIGRLLTGVMRQQTVPDEIVLIDSGSTDATLAIASAFPVRILSISPELFSFGRALNVALAETSGAVAVLASAHVYPVYDTWIDNLIDTFDDPAIALSYGRQVAPREASYSERQLLTQWFPPESVAQQTHPFCNNANAAIRRSVWEDLPYDEQLTGLEDLDWAKRALGAGHLLAYRADAPVIHVHNESFAQIVNRYRREAIAHKQIYREQRLGAVAAARLAAANIWGDLAQAASEGGAREHARDILRFRLAQFYGTYRGFAQDGPVPSLLKRRFYYPCGEPEAHRNGNAPANGRLIDYDEPLTPA